MNLLRARRYLYREYIRTFSAFLLVLLLPLVVQGAVGDWSVWGEGRYLPSRTFHGGAGLKLGVAEWSSLEMGFYGGRDTATVVQGEMGASFFWDALTWVPEVRGGMSVLWLPDEPDSSAKFGAYLSVGVRYYQNIAFWYGIHLHSQTLEGDFRPGVALSLGYDHF
ncbi:MAG: hypothetical protein VYA34_01075 [Myxococcota bacterium]|nr:hypothetical protein [Myxococcota bacterium]